MRQLLLVLLGTLAAGVHAAPLWTSAEIDFVFAGYPDDSVAFIPVGPVQNPANCTHPESYVIPPTHDARGALSVLLTAKMGNKRIYFSVRDDLCHTINQTDGGQSVPVIQRIAIK